jgi:ketosteroid isomerase-like protein
MEMVMSLTTKSEIGAIGLRALQCLSARDMAGLRALLANDAVVEWPFAGRKIVTFHGGDTAIKMFSPIQVFAKFDLIITDIHELPEAGTVVLEAHSHGIFADGRPDYVNRYVFILSVAGGRVTRWREYFNPIEGGKAFGRPDERGVTPVAVLPA